MTHKVAWIILIMVILTGMNCTGDVLSIMAPGESICIFPGRVMTVIIKPCGVPLHGTKEGVGHA